MQNNNEFENAGNFKLTEAHEKIIREKISRLPCQERIAIHCYFWEQHSYIHIARSLNVSVSDVAKIIQSALVRLRGELVEVADFYFGTISTQEKMELVA